MTLLLKYWRWALAGIALLAVLALWLTLSAEIRTLERQNKALITRNGELTRDLTQCRANTVTLQSGIEAQNRAVQAQQQASASRVATLEESLSTARRSAQTAQQRAADILARRPGADQCADALLLIRGE